MFYYINLNKNKQLIDIRLSTPISSENFHSQMENLGIINQVLILCWELNIRFIKIGKIIGEIKFGSIYTDYNIYNYNYNLVTNENFIELSNEFIYLIYNNNIINFTNGFLNYKQNRSPIEKVKVRSDIITSNNYIYKKEKLQEIFNQLSPNKNNFVVLATESEKYPNSYKLLIPDIAKKNEFKYINIIESSQPQIIVKNKTMKTRTYCLLIYVYNTNNNFIPAYVIYLSGSNSLTPNIKIADAEFESILYNCLPTPKFTNQEFYNMNNYLNQNDSKYNDLKSRAIAIDPDGSKDKDDAISFNIIKNKDKPIFLEMFVHISDVPPVINMEFNTYHFYYGFHKMETDYIYGTKYSMIDPKLSESSQSLSLYGSNKRAFTIKITYRFRPDLKSVFDIPESVELYLEKNIKIFATTYESIAKGITDYSKDLPINNQYIINHKLNYNNKNISSLNPIPCESKIAAVKDVIWENYKDINYDDKLFLKTQLNQLTEIYGILIKSLSITQEIKSLVQTKQYKNDDYQYNLREEWVHRLIEITAIEANKYTALILYLKIKDKKFGITNNNKNCVIGRLSASEIKFYNDFFSNKDRFIGTNSNEDEGIFRGLYYNVKGYNETPKYVQSNHNTCAPLSVIPQISTTGNLTNLNNLNNLYLKFQMDKINSTPTLTPLEKLLNLASFNQKSENLGIALYSTIVRPHFNTRCYYYTYFTSPMRRIVDCFVQNCLIADEKTCNKYLELFKNHLLNRTDINNQCEKYNFHVSVCNKIFNDDNKNAEFITKYIRYGNESFNNLYLPNLDITISNFVTNTNPIPNEGTVKIKFKQITEPFEIEFISEQVKVTVKEIIDEQIKLYFQKEKYPDSSTYNYYYMNYKLLC